MRLILVTICKVCHNFFNGKLNYLMCLYYIYILSNMSNIYYINVQIIAK